MTEDDVIRMMREAGFTPGRDEWVFREMLQRFARAVRAQTLEDAAKVCDRFAERGMHPAECAAAIRGMR